MLCFGRERFARDWHLKIIKRSALFDPQYADIQSAKSRSISIVVEGGVAPPRLHRCTHTTLVVDHGRFGRLLGPIAAVLHYCQGAAVTKRGWVRPLFRLDQAPQGCEFHKTTKGPSACDGLIGKAKESFNATRIQTPTRQAGFIFERPSAPTVTRKRVADSQRVLGSVKMREQTTVAVCFDFRRRRRPKSIEVGD